MDAHKAYIEVSIHASVKDATRLKDVSYRSMPCFNPRVREGRDLDRKTGLLDEVFQSTRP